MYVSRRNRQRYVLSFAGACLFLIFLSSRSSSGLFYSGESGEFLLLEELMNTNPTPVLYVGRNSFDWSQVHLKHLPPPDSVQLPNREVEPLPRIQSKKFPRETEADRVRRESRRRQVRRLFRADWRSYRSLAWGKDALKPMTGTSRDQFSGWAATLIDSLDTLWIMGFRTEFDEAMEAVAKIDFGRSSTRNVNMFETTIRYLGGLLSAYDLSGREVLLHKATELGDMLYAGFNTPNHLPVDFIDFENAKSGKGLNLEEWVASASPGSLSLEMTHLSQVTGDPKYYDVVSRLMRLFYEHQHKTRLPGLWPIWISMKHVDLDGRREFTIGSSTDSLFEYLPKMHLLLGGREPMYKTMSMSFVNSANRHLFYRPMIPTEEDVLFSGHVEIEDDGSAPLRPEMDHLSCFVGGTVALTGRLIDSSNYVEMGSKLARGCAYAYSVFPSGIMPERFVSMTCNQQQAAECPFDSSAWMRNRQSAGGNSHKGKLPPGFLASTDSRYMLRPEAIESLFVLYRITGDPTYQESAWQMFQAIAKATETKYGHASVLDVTLSRDENEAKWESTNLEDSMESFWFAETLKYFYLIFSPPDLISLDEFVFNTEAHPFKLPG